jgi:hypothetical protein
VCAARAHTTLHAADAHGLCVGLGSWALQALGAADAGVGPPL